MSEENKQDQVASSESSNKEQPEANNDQKHSNQDNGKACAVLSYFLVGIIWYFVDENMKKNDFVKFHVKQALGLTIANLVLGTVLLVTVLGSLLFPLLNLTVLVLAIIGIIDAMNGNKKELPLIGKYSTKYLKF